MEALQGFVVAIFIFGALVHQLASGPTIGEVKQPGPLLANCHRPIIVDKGGEPFLEFVVFSGLSTIKSWHIDLSQLDARLPKLLPRLVGLSRGARSWTKVLTAVVPSLSKVLASA